MNISQIYVLISVVALAVIMFVLILTRKKMGKPLSKLATVAFLFIIAGLVFNGNRFVSYGLMGVGVILAIVDTVNKSKNK